MSALHALARAAGLARNWRDAEGRDQIVSDSALAAILAALGYPAETEAQVRTSFAALEEEQARVPLFLSADVGQARPLPTSLAQARQAELHREDGGTEHLEISGGILPAIPVPGYHRLYIEGHEITLAVAPRRCVQPCDLPGVGSRKLWGPAVQIPSLRERPSAYGDLGDLHKAVRLFAERGADALAISPVHALTPGKLDGFSPYSPSSRLFLNTALAQAPGVPRDDGASLIDWPAGLVAHEAALESAFSKLTAEQRRPVEEWGRASGPALQRHTLFDALATHFAGKGWQEWPEDYRNPHGAALPRFAAEHQDRILFQLYAQWLADRSLAAVQDEAKAAGMAIGLIADLAVGVDPGGSDAWSFPEAMLHGLTIGAPPDPLGPDGQNWGLTTLSPQGLQRSGFAPWIAMVRTALRHAGGVRIDHAFGLARLWVVPAGADAGEGAYLAYPFADLLRLLALESHRAGALIVAEDLGTRPPDFVDPVEQRGILGMRVLWFEREGDGGFCPAPRFSEQALAMTSTHDTATVAGWWTARDLEWNRKLGRGAGPGAGGPTPEEARSAERLALWSAIGPAGAAAPQADDPAPVVEAALAHLGHTPSSLAIVPLEDMLAIEEQPNLPGTIDEHPNWRRRLSAPLSELLAEPATERRIGALAKARSA